MLGNNRTTRLGQKTVKLLATPLPPGQRTRVRPIRSSLSRSINGWTVFNHYPIQVKQSEHVGRPEVQKFESAIRAEKRDKGYMFAFSFSKPAYEEVARCKQVDSIEIELWQVQDLVNADPTPSLL